MTSPSTITPSRDPSARTALTRWWKAAFLVAGLALGLALPAAVSADPGDVGFAGPSGAGAGAAPSGSKPESKLWYNDGFWWGSLYDVGTSDFYIWKLDLNTNVWTRTNTVVDERNGTRADTLWDGTKLYIASHQFSESDGSGTSRLNRYSYNASTDTYTLDGGFPQTINSVRSETLVIAKDSTGQLWATWEQNGSIMVNRTTSGDSNWGTPFVLPGSPSVSSDDISSIIAFGGNKIGIMFSDQSNPDADYFVVHDDSAADTTWNAPETAYAGTDFADDHINLKTDSTGRVFAAVKTSLNGSNPGIVLLWRSTGGTWSNTTIGTASQDQTRPILIIDESSNLLRVFSVDDSSGGAITEETSPINSPSFGSGEGTIIIDDFSSGDMNNPSSTKQNVTTSTGLVVLAFEDTTDTYWHGTVFGGGGPGNAPPTAGATSASTAQGTPVVVNLSGTDAETCDLAFSIVSNPAHGTLGAITNAACTAGGPNSDTATVTYTPTAGYSGPDSFTYRVNDGTTNSSPATATITVNAGPDVTPPVRGATAVNGSTLTIVYDEALDTDPPATTAFTVNVNGTPRGVNNVSVAGSTVTLTLASPVVSSNTVTLSYVIPATDPIQDVVGNDAAAFTSAAVTNNTPPPGGPVVTFTPVADAQVKSSSANTNYGTDTTFRVREETGGVTYHSYLKFTLTGLTGAPSNVKLRVFVTDTASAATGVYAVGNTSWIESGAGGITWTNAPGISGSPLGSKAPTPVNQYVEFDLGTAGVTGNGTYTFGLKAGSTDSAIFNSREAATNKPQLVVTQGGGGPSNTPPSAGATSATTPLDTAVSVPLSGSDAETCDLTFSIVTGPAHGSLGSINNAACTGSGPFADTASVTYTPTSGYSGPDSFTYRVSDGTDFSSAATATLTVQSGPNTPPSANATSATSPFNGSVVVALSGSDAETCNLTFSIVSLPAHGTLGSISNAGCSAGSPNTDTASVTYTPTAGYDGPDSFTYKVNDGTDDSSPATATITVQANVAPTANATSATSPFNGSVAVALSGSDAGTCNLAFSIVSLPAHGSLGSISNNACVAGSPNTDSASVTYTPTTGYSGPDSFTYRVNDGTADSAPATATITVAAPGGGSQTFTPVADAQVKSSSANTNYGTDTTVRVREETGGINYNTYLKFTITGLSGAPSNVKLRLFVTDAANVPTNVYSVANTTWIESGAGGITWTNAPGITGSPLGGKAPTPVGQYVEIDLGTAGITGNGTYTFGLKATSTDSAIFNSREAATNRPQLVVTQ